MWVRIILALVVLVGAVAPASAGVEELRQLAPQGAGLYVEVIDVKGNLQRLGESDGCNYGFVPYSGTVVLLPRGGCSFVRKAMYVQVA